MLETEYKFLVDPELFLAKEIGENTGYQEYLVSIKQIEINGEVGKAQAAALEKADIQIVSGPGADLGKSLGNVVNGLLATGGGEAVLKALNKPNVD